MKTITPSALLFLVGTVVGFQIEPAMIRWLASSTGLQMVSSHVDGGFITRLFFAIGCGVLLGISPILAAWAHPRRGAIFLTIPYLFGGCAVTIGLALYHRWFLGSLPLPALAVDRPTLISIDAMPTLRLPSAGILSMIVAAALCRAVGKGDSAKQIT